MDKLNQTPCLVQTTQGVSVSYNDKLLYSKYNPSKLILQKIEGLEILPGTIFLCISPILNYGLKELSQKLPENCIMLGIEYDTALYDFTLQNQSESIPNYCLLTKQEILDLPVILNQKKYTLQNGMTLPTPGTFRRVISIEFSAGSQFNSDLYNQLQQASVNSIMNFWGNRVTLTKFGRRYSKNFFKNLKSITDTTPIFSYFKKINKPIIVFGAGESLTKDIEYIQKQQNDFFILCVDTALQPLIKHNIIPQGVFIEETQNVISKAFIGTQKALQNTQIFAGLSSLPQIKQLTSAKNISYFTTLYDNTSFIQKLNENELIPNINQPFGSVGLTAVFYSLKFRQNEQIPVYLYGLDFSYTETRTHTNGTLAHTTRILNSNKIIPIENYGAAFLNNSKVFINKQGNLMITTLILNKYAELFKNYFYNIANLYDSAGMGLDLGLPVKSCKENNYTSDKTEKNIKKESYSAEYKTLLKQYFNQEKSELLELKDILTGKIKLDKELQAKKIRELAETKEYLYLHFPDGWNFNLTQAFLNRLRIEIDLFILLF